MRSLIQEYVNKFKSLKVLVIGDVILDHYVVGTATRISREAPVPILEVDSEFDRLGGAGNVAANIASLGAKAHLVSAIGHDDLGVRTQCHNLGIRTTLFPFLPRTIKKTRMLSGNQQLLRVDWEDYLILSIEQRDQIYRKLAELMPEHDVILISDYNKGMIIEDVLYQARSMRKPVVVDPKPKNQKCYHGVDLITPNFDEALEMLGSDDASPEMAANDLSMKFGCSTLVTLGAGGMCLCGDTRQFATIPTVAKEVCDVTGAGDTVVAVMALCMAAHIDLLHASNLANIAAGIVVGRVGTSWITTEDLVAAGQRL